MKTQTRWKPKDREMYFCMNNCAEIETFWWDGGVIDKYLLRLGNCYRTRKEAQAAAKRVKAAYKG